MAEKANRIVKITKEAADILNLGVRPNQDDRVKLTIQKDDKLIAEADDLGVVACVKVDTLAISLTKDDKDKFSFFISRRILGQVIDVTKAELEITTDGESISFNSDGTVLNMQLQPFDMEIDSSYDDKAGTSIIETKTSDQLKEIVNRLSISRPDSKLAIPVIHLGKDIKYGSGSNFTIYKKGFEKIQVNVINRFIDHIANIARFGTNIDFIWDTKNKFLIVRNENISYKTKEIDQQFNDISPFIKETKASVTLSSVGVANSLNKLSIPLIGVAEQILTINIDEKSKTSLVVTVKDISEKESHDTWTAVKPSGNTKVKLNLPDVRNIARALEEAIEVSVFEKTTRFSDEVQDTFLVNYI